MPVGQKYVGDSQLMLLKKIDQCGEPDWEALQSKFLISLPFELVLVSLTCPVSIKILASPLPTRYVLVPCICMSPGFPPIIRTTSSLSFVTAGRQGNLEFRAAR
jgi:hypothetical protein